MHAVLQLGKVIGGGLPVGAYGGRKDIMQMVAPAGGEASPTLNPKPFSINPKSVGAQGGRKEIMQVVAPAGGRQHVD